MLDVIIFEIKREIFVHKCISLKLWNASARGACCNVNVASSCNAQSCRGEVVAVLDDY